MCEYRQTRRNMTETLLNCAKNTISLLKENGLTIATAESCTGGMVSAYITSVPGVSEIFELGIASYSNRIKNKVLGVKADTLDKNGAVSRQTAEEMATHVRAIADSNIGVSVTGVAGPAQSEGKLPGTVYIALADKKSVYIEKLAIEPKSRDFVREITVKSVFELIDKYVKKNYNKE